MTDLVLGLIHPGEMGAALGAALRADGREVLYASAGRSDATAGRAREAGLEDVGTIEELRRRADLLLSVCPPHAAAEVAASVAGFTGMYVDANAVSPATARALAAEVERGGARFVDGGIVGPPPRRAGVTRLYLSGIDAHQASDVLGTPLIDARVVSDEIGAASAVKMTYAAWSKGTAAMLLAIQAVARAERVEEALLAEWALSLPGLAERLAQAERSAETKGWRWIGEMEEIAATFAAVGEPPGFHEAAAEVFRRSHSSATLES
jgi:3-hydroxyisobutyrate dehydrogenase-like beta-hydroxyacid dehydrogenase